MICVSIGHGRHRYMIAEHRHLAEQGAKLVELRLDYIHGPVNLKRLLNDRPTPVVVSCRRPADGGKWTGPEDQRRMLLRTAVVEGCEYIDLEDDVAGEIRRYGKTKRIVSLHDFRKTPANLDEIHARLAALDPDIIKISAMANHPHDNLRLLEVIQKSTIPTASLGMGDIGVPTRILAGRFGAALTYATCQNDRALAPGQLSYEQMTQMYRFDQINAETEVYGVVADPVGHSLSPLIHNAGFAQLGLNKVYVPFRVPREDLDQFVDDCPRFGVKGLSVTIPHKEEVLRKLTEMHGAVQGIGAANTVIFDGDKRLGHNTDYHAAMSSLEDALSIPRGAEKPFMGRKALVLGCGGVGMAFVYGLVERGAQVFVADGMAKKSAAMAERFDCVDLEWNARHTITPDILVNCTPVGMHPNVDDSPYDKHHLRPSMVVFDAVYNPENTLLIKEARSRNCGVVTGIEMFVRQACLQFQLFTGHEGPADLMRELIRRSIGAVKY
jgi:3-dehydroquinate dehydratase/shikimate dehydrogenase